MYISSLKKELENKEFLVLFWFQIKGLHFDSQPHGEMLKKNLIFWFLIKSIQKHDIQPQ